MMERMKLTNICIQEHLNLNALISDGYIKQIFCLNDDYELWGGSVERYFELLMKRRFSLETLWTKENYQHLYDEITTIIK